MNRWAVALLLIAACGVRAQRPSTERQEIIVLDGQIAEHRRALGLAPRPDPALVQELRGQPPLPARIERQSPDRCPEVCDLAERICKAQEDLCRVARALDDEWARDKCDNAKASCSEARRRCRECPAR